MIASSLDERCDIFLVKYSFDYVYYITRPLSNIAEEAAYEYVKETSENNKELYVMIRLFDLLNLTQLNDYLDGKLLEFDEEKLHIFCNNLLFKNKITFSPEVQFRLVNSSNVGYDLIKNPIDEVLELHRFKHIL